MVRGILGDARSSEIQGPEGQVFQSIMGATEKRRERACGGARAEGIGVLDGECEGWGVYQEWVEGGLGGDRAMRDPNIK